MNLDWTQLRPELTNCGALTNVYCTTCTFGDTKKGLKELDAKSRPAVTNITSLVLQGSTVVGKASLVDWLEICPRLETLVVLNDKMPWLDPVSQLSPGPQLSGLTFDCARLKDAELAEVLARCSRLKFLTLHNASISRPVFASLSGHFDSLTRVIEQGMVREIFECCPRLEQLAVAEVDLKSLYRTALNGQDLPWACRHSLKTLYILTIRVSLDSSLNDRFIKHLMDLKQLEELHIKAIYREGLRRRTIDPWDVPGDTPETLFLGTLCECKDTIIPVHLVQRTSSFGLLKEVWPKMQCLTYIRDQNHDDIDNYVDDGFSNVFGSDYGDDDYDSYGDDFYNDDDYDYDYDYDYHFDYDDE
ncbi:hypothetical protein EC968_006253 [Mortierella alpina]|nr:hypothetical protein EC968_006253 [Mortierella alpina]